MGFKLRIQVYGYDELDRLSTVDNPTLDDEAYTYDALGNRLTDTAQTYSWVYNLNNEITTIGADTTYTYDNHGSMINVSKPGLVRELIYNTENRLAEVKENTISVASYGYDAFGHRVVKQVSGQTTYYLYSDEGLIAEMDNTGAINKQYGWQPDSMWGVDPVYLRDSNDIYFYQNDNLGTPQKIISRSGEIVWSSHYRSFGEADIQIQTVINNLRFPGQYYDAETDLHYNYFRDYDPALGRYIESDPIGLLGGLNVFSYAENNSINSIDNNGLYVLRFVLEIFPDVACEAYISYKNKKIAEQRTAAGKELDSSMKDAADALAINMASCKFSYDYCLSLNGVDECDKDMDCSGIYNKCARSARKVNLGNINRANKKYRDKMKNLQYVNSSFWCPPITIKRYF